MQGRTLFGLTVVLGMAMSTAAAPVEQPYDLIRCSSGTFVMVSASDELTVGSFEEFGIVRSNHQNKLFDNWPFHCVGIQRVMGSQATVSGYCKYLAPNGDFVVGEFTSVGTEGKWRFLQGTGKWKGIKGGGSTEPTVTRIQSITPGTFQVCGGAMGTFTLPAD